MNLCHKDPKALALIRALMIAVDEELSAAGPDDVRSHPTLQSHKRIAERAARYLAKHDPKAGQ